MTIIFSDDVVVMLQKGFLREEAVRKRHVGYTNL